MSAPKVISRADLEAALDEGLTREEMAYRWKICLRLVGTLMKGYGNTQANARLLKARQERVLTDWRQHQDCRPLDTLYRAIAKRTRLSITFVEKTIVEHQLGCNVKPERGSIKPIVTAYVPQWGDQLYMGKKTTVISTLDGFHQIMVSGSTTWVPVCEVVTV